MTKHKIKTPSDPGRCHRVASFNPLWFLPWCGDVSAVVAAGIWILSPVLAPLQGVDHRLVIRTRFGPVLHRQIWSTIMQHHTLHTAFLCYIDTESLLDFLTVGHVYNFWWKCVIILTFYKQWIICKNKNKTTTIAFRRCKIFKYINLMIWFYNILKIMTNIVHKLVQYCPI